MWPTSCQVRAKTQVELAVERARIAVPLGGDGPRRRRGPGRTSTRSAACSALLANPPARRTSSSRRRPAEAPGTARCARPSSRAGFAWRENRPGSSSSVSSASWNLSTVQSRSETIISSSMSERTSSRATPMRTKAAVPYGIPLAQEPVDLVADAQVGAVVAEQRDAVGDPVLADAAGRCARASTGASRRIRARPPRPARRGRPRSCETAFWYPARKSPSLLPKCWKTEPLAIESSVAMSSMRDAW